MTKTNIVQVTAQSQLAAFETNLEKQTNAIINLLGNKYGITPEEFMIKAINSIKKTPQLLQCSPQSLLGSIMYFAEVGLSFDTPEGFGYILIDKRAKSFEAIPLLGYKGLIEIAYRNPSLKSIRIQAVYENDDFDYEYGTQEYIKHKPVKTGQRGGLTHVYAIAKLDGVEPMFVVVNRIELDEIQKMSISGKGSGNAYTNGADIFNIMQSKVAIKLLFKTLPKTGNAQLINALELDNKFDYKKNVKIEATEDGYMVIEEKPKTDALETTLLPEMNITQSDKYLELEQSKMLEQRQSDLSELENEKLTALNENGEA